MAVTAKTFEYAAAVDRTGRVSVDDSPFADVPADWKPEHLLLAGLIRCTLASLRYHAREAGIDDLVASGAAAGRVTRREEDGRYAFVEIECNFEVELEPALAPDDVAELVAHAVRYCFVPAALTSSPRSRWMMNGEYVSDG